jgi:hypothetical protein
MIEVDNRGGTVGLQTHVYEEWITTISRLRRERMINPSWGLEDPHDLLL